MTDELAPPGQSRARARVAEILAVMLADRWERGKTTGEIASRYNVSVATVEKEAVVASHCLNALSGGGIERARDAINTRVDAITRRFEDATDPTEAKLALEGLRDLARNYGLHSHVQPRGAADPPTAAANDELRELLRDPPGWLADMLAAHGWMRIESEAG